MGLTQAARTHASVDSVMRLSHARSRDAALVSQSNWPPGRTKWAPGRLPIGLATAISGSCARSGRHTPCTARKVPHGSTPSARLCDMTTVADVLSKHGLAASEDEVATRLDALLSAPGPDSMVGMSAADLKYLNAFGGVFQVSDDELVGLTARSAARVAADAAQTLDRTAVAELLGITPSRVSHQVAEGKLYSYPGTGARPMFPSWQFTFPAGISAGLATVLPHLAAVLAAIPEGAHPTAVRSFMTTPIEDLAVDGPMSPREWLRQGGAPDIVAALAATLGEQV